MFYCTQCAKEAGWPEKVFKSLGPCEICGHTRPCNDVPSRLLPESKKEETRP